MNEYKMRKIALLLLNEQNGIAEEAYELMKRNLDADIVSEVKVDKGRAFIGEDFAEAALAEMGDYDDTVAVEVREAVVPV